MADFIEREAALEAIQNLYPGIPFTKRLMQKWHEENRNFMQCEIAIERLPAADVVPVRHGRLLNPNPYGECSLCGQLIDIRDSHNYCPNCGAHMTEVVE